MPAQRSREGNREKGALELARLAAAVEMSSCPNIIIIISLLILLQFCMNRVIRKVSLCFDRLSALFTQTHGNAK